VCNNQVAVAAKKENGVKNDCRSTQKPKRQSTHVTNGSLQGLKRARPKKVLRTTYFSRRKGKRREEKKIDQRNKSTV